MNVPRMQKNGFVSEFKIWAVAGVGGWGGGGGGGSRWTWGSLVGSDCWKFAPHPLSPSQYSEPSHAYEIRVYKSFILLANIADQRAFKIRGVRLSDDGFQDICFQINYTYNPIFLKYIQVQ